MDKLKLARIGLIVNAVFWLALIAYYSLFMQGSNVDNLFVKVVLVVEAIMYVSLYFGLRNKIRFAYATALIVTAMNALLSVTDQVGAHDIVSFVLNALAFVLLLRVKDEFRVKK